MVKPQAGPSPLERYFLILEAVAAYPKINAAEIAEICDLPFPTAHRLLQGLSKSGLVVGGDKRRGFELGPRLLRLLQTGSDDAWIRITAQRKLDEIAERFSETCFLAKLVGDKVASVAWASPPSGLRGFVVPGQTQPLHAAASAKAILAYQPKEFVRSVLAGPLPKLCINTKTRIADVLADIEQVRQRGYATCINENELGVTAVACPVPIPDVGVIYSVGVMTLSDHLPQTKITEAAGILKETAAALSANAGPLRTQDRQSSLTGGG